MKKFFLLIASLSLAILINAQDINYARDIIDTLCSKEMYGRGYLFDGDKKAANFIEAEFERIGLQKFEYSYQQKFNLDINTFEGRQVLKINGKELKLGKDYILSPNSGSGKGEVKFISFKQFTEEKSCKTKGIVMTNSNYNKLLLNKKMLSKALMASIIIKLNDSKLTASLAQYQLPIPVVEILVENDLNFKKVEFDINSELKKDYQSQNVIGMTKGSIYPDSFQVLCAHYDHLGGMGDVYFPGANDNAAGIAMLIEMARFYKLNPPKYSMIFIAFGGEEAGLVGSKYFVENPLIDLKNIKFLMNMDLVGTGEKGITVVNGKVFTDEFEKLVSINNKFKLLTHIKSRGKAANSDHHHFTEAGVPSFFIYAMGEPGHYHDINDNGSDLKLEEFKDIFKLINEYYK